MPIVPGALLRAEERLKAKLDSVKDPGKTFEATGVDYLAIDGAHGHKNLSTCVAETLIHVARPGDIR